MISAEALVALTGLDRGRQYNTMHTTARELMKLGLAQDDWGHLAISESGRRFIRRGKYEIAITSDDNMSDLSVHRSQKNYKIDPMASPQHVNQCQSEPTLHVELLPEAPPEPMPIAESRMQEMLRAAGVASGKTGVWVDDKWVEEFVRALDGDK